MQYSTLERHIAIVAEKRVAYSCAQHIAVLDGRFQNIP